MAPTNLIVNGTFDRGSAGWDGNDIEARHTENAYLRNGSSNRVAEMDGNRNATTEMEQSFTVDNPTVTELSIDVALRNAALDEAGEDGFTVEILNADGEVIARETILPTENEFETFTVPVEFTEPGEYTLRMTEVGNDDSLGAIIDNVELFVCFHGDARILTPAGAVKAADVKVGDLVETQNGVQAVRWVGRRHVTTDQMAQTDKLCPVRISAGSLGNGLPERDLLVSRQHRMVVSAAQAKRICGAEEVLVSAIRLTALPGIFVDDTVDAFDYVHILLDNHEILYANGAPSESLLMGEGAQATLSQEALDEIALIFPDFDQSQDLMTSAKAIPANADQTKLIAQIKRSARPVLKSV